MLLQKLWSVALLPPRPERVISRTGRRSPRPGFLAAPRRRRIPSRAPAQFARTTKCIEEVPPKDFVCFSFAVFTLFSKTSVSPFASFASAALSSSAESMSAWSGLTAGFLHTLAGPDHFAGLTPLTLRQDQITAVSLGALWGFGHSSGTLILGILFYFLKERFNGMIPMLSKWSALIVGITLIAIGFLGIYEGVFEKSEDHHEHSNDTLPVKGSLTKKTVGTFVMGVVHGLQLDALFVVLPALALPTAFSTISYVTTFVIGTVIAMAGYTFAIVTASDIAVQKRPWLLNHLSTFAGAVALLFGAVIIIGSLTQKIGT